MPPATQSCTHGAFAVLFGSALACTVACGEADSAAGAPSDGPRADDGGASSSSSGGPGVPCEAGPCTTQKARVLLFGGATDYRPGFSSDTPLFSDTWSWDGTVWTSLDVAGPPARAEGAMARLGDDIVLFGGRTHSGDDLAATWLWNGTSWSPASTPKPAPRGDDATMATLGGEIVLFSGGSGETWTFDGNAWSKLDVPGPSARTQPSMATVAGKIFLYGGQDRDEGQGDRCLNDTWTWDGATWKQVDDAPPTLGGCWNPRQPMAALGNSLVRVHRSTFEWNGSGWTKLDVPDLGFIGGSMTALGDELVLFGGVEAELSPKSVQSTTHTWNGTRWATAPVAGPPARIDASLGSSP